MMASTPAQACQTPGRPLSQLQPFNEARFDSAIAYLVRKNQRPLSKYEIVKLHVLMDIIHTLGHGSPIIGGKLEAWDLGPVVDEAYARLETWCNQLEYDDGELDNFTVEVRGKRKYLSPKFTADPEDFSASELQAMEQAWAQFIPMMDRGFTGYKESREYFHSDDTYIGRAYNKAKAESRDIDWNDIIDAYDQIHQTDHSDIKLLMQF